MTGEDPRVSNPSLLTVSGLCKRYATANATQSVFDGLDMHAARGEVVALLGASGSGKTTLLNLLSGIDTPDGGSVTIDGVALHRRNEPQRTLFRRHHIGIVFQFFNLIPTLTVSENVALPLELIGTERKAAARRASALLQRVGLAGFDLRYPDSLSGGEQQRTAIARALAHRPKLLLADEPTGNLDAQTARTVIALLSELAREQATTMVLVTHSEEVAARADRVLQLVDGGLQSR